MTTHECGRHGRRRELRQEVTANTNKIESYNGFFKWLSFGGDVIAENDPDEQQKRREARRLLNEAALAAERESVGA